MKNLKLLLGLLLTASFLAACSSPQKAPAPTVYPPITDAPCAVVPAK